jgi:hypothetical protein
MLPDPDTTQYGQLVWGQARWAAFATVTSTGTTIELVITVP